MRTTSTGGGHSSFGENEQGGQQSLDGALFKMYSNMYMQGGALMNTITYTAARANLADTMDRVCNDHEAVIITRKSDQAVVMISLEEYNALEETAHLLRTPANAGRLLSAVSQLRAGEGVERKPAE